MRFLFVSILCSITLFGQSYHPSEPNLKAREWFQNARFGMFIHWGVYSVLGDGEWVMNNRKMTVARV
jgi:alpha-L-fucosidase